MEVTRGQGIAFILGAIVLMSYLFTFVLGWSNGSSRIEYTSEPMPTEQAAQTIPQTVIFQVNASKNHCIVLNGNDVNPEDCFNAS